MALLSIHLSVCRYLRVINVMPRYSQQIVNLKIFTDIHKKQSVETKIIRPVRAGFKI